MYSNVTILRHSDNENSDSELIKEIKKKNLKGPNGTLLVIYFLIFTKCSTIKQEQINMIHLLKKIKTVTKSLTMSQLNTIIKYIFVDRVFFEIREFDPRKRVINFKEEASLPKEYLNNISTLESNGKIKAHLFFLIDEARYSKESLNSIIDFLINKQI